SERNAASSPAVSGLFLVQFTAPPTPEERSQLAAMGVDLLHFVPNDTFVARFRAARLEQVQVLPFVQWVGEYRPEHKVHRSLNSQAAAQLTNETVGVTVLLAPRAGPGEIGEVRRSLAAVRQESNLRCG